MSRAAMVLGMVVTFGLLISVAFGIGFGSNTYLFQDGSKPLTADWDTGNFQITNIELWVSDGGEITGDNKIIWRDAQISISSDTDGHMDIDADVSIDLNALTVLGSNVLQFFDSDVEIWSSADSILNLKADGYVHINASSVWMPIYGSDYGMVLCLDFEEGSGSIAYDQSPYGNDGTITDAVWSDGKFGEALDFDGTGDFVIVDDDSSIDLPNDYTIMFWLKTDVWENDKDLLGKYAGANYNYHIFTKTTGIRFQTYDGTNNPVRTIETTSTDWLHFCVVRDNITNQEYYFYLNGNLVYTLADTITGVIVNNAPIGIAATSGGFSEFNGKQDQIRIISRVLSGDEIRTHYLNTKGQYSRSVTVSNAFRILGTDLDPDFSIVDGTVDIFNGNLDMNLNYVLDFEQRNWLHIMSDQGVTDVSITAIPAGTHSQDEHYSMLMVSLGTAPGADKTFSVTIGDGTNEMVVSISGADVFDSTMVGAFDLDVSAENFLITYSQTAGGATDHACVMMHWHYKENE